MINIEGSVLIKRDLNTVFSFVSNYANDSVWRKEINYSKLNVNINLWAILTESSNLSKKVPNNILEYKCTDFLPLSLISSTTIDNSIFKQISTRETVMFQIV